MRFSVVICSANRRAGLQGTLSALVHQVFADFEVIIVKGPCDDDTDRLLEEWGCSVRIVENPAYNLSKSRNLGIDLAAGEIVAFIDDDALPEPRWLQDLADAYTDELIGGAGGVVYGTTGVNLQYHYAVCDRLGRTNFHRNPPFDAVMVPGADPFVYLQGTNMSFRRDALLAVGGFDENLEYMWDDVDVALQMLDAGWKLAPLDRAVVHHKVLPSSLRRDNGFVTDPYTAVKNRSYFALRNGRKRHPLEHVLHALTEYLAELRSHAENSHRDGVFSAEERENYVARMEAGFESGVQLGMGASRAVGHFVRSDPEPFVPFPRIQPEGRRLSVCFVSRDYPPTAMGGIARYTYDFARAMAARGHEVRVITRAQGPYRMELEEGVWVYRHPAVERLLPSLDGHPLRDNLAHIATVWRVVNQIVRRAPVDVVAGNVWLGEILACSLDPRFPTVVTSSTPMRTIADTQPAVAAKPETRWHIRLEDATVRRADNLHSLSSANLVQLRQFTPGANEIPTSVVPLGMIDRAGAMSPARRNGDSVEILFVGRLEPRKGIDTLLDAAVSLMRERPQVRLRIVGAENPYASDAALPYSLQIDQRLQAETELRRRVTFQGEVTDAMLDQLLFGCDIFCAPSRYESFGLMNLEAMMFARPVVSCRTGGIEEVVVDGETGLLVPTDDAEALTTALRTLVDDPELRLQMGTAGRRRFERGFTVDTAIQQMIELFGQTVDRGPRRPITEAEAEEEVRAGLLQVLRELGGVEQPRRAVEQLLDACAFPRDYGAAVQSLRGADIRDFVTGVYRAILEREPGAAGLDWATTAISTGAFTRAGFVRHVASSAEARALGVDDRFLAKLDADAPQPAAVEPPADAPAKGRVPRLRGRKRVTQIGPALGRHRASLRLAQELQQTRAKVDGLAEQVNELGAVMHELGGRRGSPTNESSPNLSNGAHATYVGRGRVLVGMTWGGMLLSPADDLSLTPELVAHGVYEPALTNYLIRHLRPGQTVVDAGANIGMYTVLMAGWVGAEGRVVAYEPNPDLVNYLRQNLALNWLSDRVEVRVAGVSNVPGRATLHVSERFMGNSSLLAPDDHYFANAPMDTVRTVEVDVEPLDALADELGHIDLVKLDLEGAECLAIRGMSELLEGGGVDRVAFEVYRERMGPDWLRFCDELRRHAARGCVFHRISSDGELQQTDLEDVIAVGRFSQVLMSQPGL